MQQNQRQSKRAFWIILILLSVFSVFSISSCEKKPPKGLCISLSKSKIDKAWSSYIKNGEIDYLTFITFYNSITHEMIVSVQAFKKNHNPIGPSVKLYTEEGCADLLPKVAVGENTASLKELDILSENGKEFKDFGYLVLTPYSYEGYLAFKTRVVDKNNKALSITLESTLPCPPCINCRPPCPTLCSPPCTPEQLDSIQRLDTGLNSNLNINRGDSLSR
jgi:hypothetical protein